MKIVIIASIAGKEYLIENYKIISELCKKNGNEVFDDYIFKHRRDILRKSSITILKEIHNNMILKIKQCDFMIVESTQSSLSVGRYVGVSLQYHKPILVLYTDHPPRALIADPTRLITLKKYSLDDKKDLKEKLEHFFKQAEKKIFIYRFNVMLSHEINNYLLYKANENSISKSDYVRKLIVSDMNKNTTKE